MQMARTLASGGGSCGLKLIASSKQPAAAPVVVTVQPNRTPRLREPPPSVHSQLAVAPLDWSRITVGLVDERWLSPQDSASNARLVRESLLERADVGHFEPLVREGSTLAESVHAANLEAEHAHPNLPGSLR